MYKQIYIFGNETRNEANQESCPYNKHNNSPDNKDQAQSVKNMSARTLYDKGRQYGFVDQEHIGGNTNSEQSLHNGGWNLRASAKDIWKNSLCDFEGGVKITKERFVMIFKADVPEFGTYRISVKYTADTDVKDMRIFAGRRNLIERNISLKSGETYCRSFFVHVTPYIPAMTYLPCEEKAVYVSVSGLNAGLGEVAIERSDAPTLFIAGDSTLTDQNALFPYYPYASCGGWAQVLSQYFEEIAVCNQAHSGLTTNCFRDDGHWQIVKDHIKKGDIFMLQFGHNDQKRRNLKAFGGYIDNLRWYIKKVRELGAIPILLSPISRIPIDDNGQKRSLLSDHALACKVCAGECNVPFIDLHKLTFDLWCSLGDSAKDYFMKGDITHTNDYGACRIAEFVANEIKTQKIEPLNKYLENESAESLSQKPAFLPDSDTKEIPSEPSVGGMFSISLPYMDVTDDIQKAQMTEAFKRGLLDPCVMHLHPDEVMPRAQFLMVYFKALRTAGIRPYNGRFCDLSRYEWDSSYVEACIQQNLIDPDTVADDRFRPDDPLTVGEFASFAIRGTRPDPSLRNLSLADCYDEALAKHLIKADKGMAENITRCECYYGLVQLMNLLDNADKALPSDAEIHPVG